MSWCKLVFVAAGFNLNLPQTPNAGFLFKWPIVKQIRESPPHFENQIMAQVYVRSITRSTLYQKALFC